MNSNLGHSLSPLPFPSIAVDGAEQASRQMHANRAWANSRDKNPKLAILGIFTKALATHLAITGDSPSSLEKDFLALLEAELKSQTPKGSGFNRQRRAQLQTSSAHPLLQTAPG